MLVCEECKQDVYIQQRNSEAVWQSIDEPYYCWYCEKFRNYNEVEKKKGGK